MRFRTSGFTIVEMLVVVGVTTLLSSMVLSYSSSSRGQITLLVEKAKISQIISRAKTMSIATYKDTSATPPCGYGVDFDYTTGQYGIFRYVAASCANITSINLPSKVAVPGFQYVLPTGLNFTTGSNALYNVLFLPPDPKTILADNSGASLGGSGTVYLNSVSSGTGRWW